MRIKEGLKELAWKLEWEVWDPFVWFLQEHWWAHALFVIAISVAVYLIAISVLFHLMAGGYIPLPSWL